MLQGVGGPGPFEPWEPDAGTIDAAGIGRAVDDAALAHPARVAGAPSPAPAAAAPPPAARPEPRPRDAREALAGQTPLLVARGKTDDAAREITVRLLWDAGRGNVAALVGAPPAQAAAALDEALAKANPQLAPADRAKLRDAVQGNLASYKVSLPWVTPASGDAFSELGKDVQAFLGTRMKADTLDPWRRADFERQYQAVTHRPPPAGAAERNTAYASWYYNEVMTPPQRMSLACMCAKMKTEGLTDAVDALNYIAPDGVLLFTPKGGQGELQKTLAAKGYGDWWAASKDHPWGMRDHERGVQFHFRGSNDLTVNMHLDLHNPGDPPGGRSNVLEELPGAVTHYIQDLRGWEENHTADEVLQHLESSGIKVPRPGQG